MPAGLAYFDTSVLVKWYVREPGSPRARVLLRRYRVLPSAIAPLEAISALSRRRATGDLGQEDLAALIARIQEDRAHWELIEVGAQILRRAEELVQGTHLRTLDAVHVASLMAFHVMTRTRIPLVTGDVRQRDAASALGLQVIWVP